MRSARTVPPMPVPDEEALDALPLPFDACARCGYLGVHAPTYEDGVVAGSGALFSERVCSRCGFQGLPVGFDQADDYVRFLQDLHAAPPAGAEPF